MLVLEFLFLSFPFAFALLLAKHTTEVMMAAPTREPTTAPTMIPTSGSGGYKQLVSKLEHIVSASYMCFSDQWGILGAFID